MTGTRWWAALSAVVSVAVAAGCGARPGPPSIPVGATASPEAQLIAQLYVSALRFYGNPAHVQTSDDPVGDLDSGAVQVAPGSTGALLARFQPGAVARSDVQVYRTLLASLPEGVAAGDYTVSAEDKPALAVREPTAVAWGARDVTAAASRCAQLSLAAVEGRSEPATLGTCRLPAARDVADDDALFASLTDGRSVAVWTSTAAPDVPSDVAVLSDKTSLVRAENVVPLYRRNELRENQVLALNEIAGVLDTGSLADMRRQVAEGTDPALVAGRWLEQHPLGVSN